MHARFRAEVSAGITDYRAIHGFGIQPGHREHARDVQWLKKEFESARATGDVCIVLTHHPPLMQNTSHPIYEVPNNPLRHAFANDLSRLLHDFADVIDIWIHGHTHYTHTHMFRSASKKNDESVIIASNQRGYDDEEGRGFSLDAQPICVL